MDDEAKKLLIFLGFMVTLLIVVILIPSSSGKENLGVNPPYDVYLSSPSDSLEFGTLAVLQPHAFDFRDKNEKFDWIKKARLYEVISKDTSYYEEVYQDTTLFGEVSYEKGTTSLGGEDPFYVVKAKPGNYSYFLEVEDTDGNKVQSDLISVTFTRQLSEDNLEAAMVKTSERIEEVNRKVIPTLNLIAYGPWKKVTLWEDYREILEFGDVDYGKNEWVLDLEEVSSDPRGNYDNSYTYTLEVEDEQNRVISLSKTLEGKKANISKYAGDRNTSIFLKVVVIVIGSVIILMFLSLLSDLYKVIRKKKKGKLRKKLNKLNNKVKILNKEALASNSLFGDVERALENKKLDKNSRVFIEDTRKKIFLLIDKLNKEIKCKKALSGQITKSKTFKKETDELVGDCKNDVSLALELQTKEVIDQSNDQLTELQKKNSLLDEQIQQHKDELKELCNLLEQKVKCAEFSVRETEVSKDYKHLRKGTEKVLRKVQHSLED